jgi:hypothetical protein
MDHEPKDFTLHYCSELVGYITNAFVSDETWSGIFQPVIGKATTASLERALKYIAFCEKWNAEIRDSQDHAADASGFDDFADVISSKQWTVALKNGESAGTIEDAPVFFPEAEVSFRLIQHLKQS